MDHHEQSKVFTKLPPLPPPLSKLITLGRYFAVVNISISKNSEYHIKIPLKIFCYLVCFLCSLISMEIYPTYLLGNKWVLNNQFAHTFSFICFITAFVVQQSLCYPICLLKCQAIIKILVKLQNTKIKQTGFCPVFWVLLIFSILNIVGNGIVSREDLTAIITSPQFLQNHYFFLFRCRMV